MDIAVLVHGENIEDDALAQAQMCFLVTAVVWHTGIPPLAEDGVMMLDHAMVHHSLLQKAFHIADGQRLIIAAHGSWESGSMPTQDLRRPPRASDLFAFKAHFCNSTLPPDLMPLLAFPGGYGGMVHTDRGRVSLSCCIRRDRLEQCRRQWPRARAGEAVLAHIESSCRGVVLALSSAQRDGAWLSSGPLVPGWWARDRRA